MNGDYQLNVTVDAKTLRDAVALGAYGRAIPILAHTLIEDPEDGTNTIRITSTDTQIRLSTIIPAEISESGAVAVEAERLKACLTGIDGPVAVAHDGGVTVVRSGRRRFAVPSLPAQDFPDMERLESVEVEWEPLSVRDAIKAVRYAAAKHDVRHYLKGVYLESGHAVANDGHRLAVFPARVDLPDGCDFIIPIGAAQQVAGFIGEKTRCRIMRMGSDAPSFVEFVDDNRTLAVRLLDGQYTKWRQIEGLVVERFRLRANAAELRVAVSRVVAFCADLSAQIDVVISDGVLQISPHAYSDGNAMDFVTLEEWSGDAITASISGSYLLDILSAAGDGALTWIGPSEADRNAPHVFRVDGSLGAHYLAGMRS